MTLETTPDATRLAPRGRAIILGAIVALACSACASEEKAGGSGPGAGMTPPPMTAAYDPTRTMSSGLPSSLWGASQAPSVMPTAAANGSALAR